MEFISNLIKRPISLVRSDSLPPASNEPRQDTSNSRPISPKQTPSPSHSPLLTFDRATTPDPLQQHLVSSLMVTSNIIEAMNRQDEFRPITVAATTRASLPISQSPTQAQSHSLQTSTSSNVSAGGNMNPPSNNVGNTIEELLIEINNNLSKQDDLLVHTAGALSQHHLPNRPLSLSPTALTQPLATEYNAVCSQNANLKATPSTQSTESLSSSSSLLKSTAMAPVADSVSTTSFTVTETEPKAGSFDGSTPVSLKTGANIDIKCETASDLIETKTPEMLTALNLNAEDRAKLTFEDGLIPTLTAAISEHEKHDGTLGKGNSNSAQYLMVQLEPDTAASSDNETFTECQSYQIASANDYGFIADEYSFENSEIESYFSAANSRNATLTTGEADPLSVTINKTSEQNESEQGDLQSQVSAISGDDLLATHQHSLDVTFDEEPMDVDESFTELKQNVNVETCQLHTTNVGVDNESTSKTAEPESVVTNGEATEVKQLNCTKNEAVPKDAAVPQPETELEITQSKLELSLNKSIEIPTSTTQKNNYEDNQLDISSTETFSEVTVDLTQATIATTSSTSIHSANTSLHPIEEELLKYKIPGKQEFGKSWTGSQNALNLTVDMDSSTQSNKSSASSPSFPIKHKGNSLKQFPRSPTAAVPKSMTFLEKSEYTERIETERKKSTASEPKLELFGSRKTSTVDEKPTQHAITENLAACITSTTVCPNEPNNDEVASTKINGNAATDEVAPLTSASSIDSSDKRRTYNVTAPVKPSPEIESVTQKCVNDHEKRRTFNMPAAPQAPSIVGQKSERDEDKRRTFNMPVSTQETDMTTQKPENEGNNRRTFNLMGSEDIIEKKISSENNSDTAERPRTYIVSEPTFPMRPNSEGINVPMDIDDTLPTDAGQNNTTQSRTPMQSPTTTVSSSPPIPPLQNRIGNTIPTNTSPPIPTLQNRARNDQTQLIMDDDAFKVPLPPSPASSTASPPTATIHKRPSIHAYKNTEDVVEALSAKEQTKRDASDEKDVFAGNCTPSPMEEQPSSTSNFGDFGSNLNVDVDQQEFAIILNPSDFDYLLTKGNNSAPIDRSSILLKFDPLLGVPVPANQVQQQKPTKQTPQILQNILGSNLTNLSPTLEEDEHSSSASTSSISNNQSFVVETDNKRKSDEEESTKSKQNFIKILAEKQQRQQQQYQQPTVLKKHDSMSVDVIKDMNIDNDCNKSFENSNSQPDEKQINYKMDELEKKIKNEVLKTEDIEKKLKEAEQREEALIKRITEKDKTITKMTGVIEAYEKAIAELIAEKEQLLQSYEKQLAEVKADRDSNYQHLTSLETTFADLHVKYGKSKEMTLQLKADEEALVVEKRQILENLRLQEQRYEKMKNHAMQQLEIANKKLESLNKEHSIETTKLKALLKKEEISRASINEQLQQKSRENAELVKICDELINGQGS
ncbi:PREDICTED: transforming acidic coiled-coil-containing protein 2 isoform X2 [Bactrocera latifrons]|uniref:transforming acidic coiled-coil-containing protein 2 isoform X2 n=1 Tax=Bactrocera latifrons TaxID=174628 RepID=UPI0008DD690F|nr:PREDICTED: transforming acidic coiled-coil-containing protein 2 isoform X2 [Bactrocera latifrons]